LAEAWGVVGEALGGPECASSLRAAGEALMSAGRLGLGPPPPPAAAAALARLRPELPVAPPRDLIQFLRGLAAAGLRPGAPSGGARGAAAGVWGDLFERLAELAPEMTPLELSQALHSLAKLRAYPPPPAAAGRPGRGAQGPSGDAQALSRAWAGLEERARELAPELSARGAADVLWAWGTARRRPRNAACAAVLGRAERAAVEMNSQDVANAAWGGQHLVKQLRDGGRGRGGGGRGGQGALRAESRALGASLADRAGALAAAGAAEPRHLALAVWSLGQAGGWGLPGPPRAPGGGAPRAGAPREAVAQIEGALFGAAGEEGGAPLPRLRAMHVAQALQGFRGLGHRPADEALQQCARHLEVRAGDYKCYEAAGVVEAFATWGYDPGARCVSRLCRTFLLSVGASSDGRKNSGGERGPADDEQSSGGGGKQGPGGARGQGSKGGAPKEDLRSWARMLAAVGALGPAVDRVPAAPESAALEARCRELAPALPALAVKDVLTGLRGIDAEASPLTLFPLGRRLEAARPKFPRDDLFLDALEAFLLLGGTWEPESQRGGGGGGRPGGGQSSVTGGADGAGGADGNGADEGPRSSELWPADI